MKRHPWMVAWFGVLGAMLPSGHAFADSPQIVLYDGPNFTGEQRVIYNDVSNLNRERFNDRVESMVVISGTWEVCADVNYRGRCQTLNPGSYGDLSSMGLQDTISSIELVGDAGTPGITLYENTDFQGNSLALNASVNNLIPRGFNDAASSVQISAGTWKVCADVNYRGNCQTLNPGTYSNLSTLGLQDTISSVELVGAAETAGVTLYEAPNFQGASLAITGASSSLIRQNFNDRAASLIISSGNWEVCEDVNYRGRCQRLGPGSYGDLNSFGLMQTISSIRPAN